MNLERYHAERSVEHQPFRSACYAPHVGLTFDMHGMVSVCAFTRATPVGRIGDAPLMDIWRGASIDRIRAAVDADDLRTYCTRCAEEIGGGNLHGVFARSFDGFRVDTDWPRRMEFSLSTTCNLQCVMCSGEFSSSIRRQREALPPLRSPYGESFLEELAPFLPHLQQARFLGGEPFLSDLNFRIWELMCEVAPTVECNVTTNGTQWTPRVQKVLERLRFSIGISLDGVSRDTVESIRAGASYDEVMANVDRFLEYGRRHETSVSFTYCLMVPNWHEFADYLRFAERHGCPVFVNTVRQPPQFSLYRLPVDELEQVVDHLQSDRDRVASELVLNRQVWLEQVDRLANHLARRRGLGSPGLVDPTVTDDQLSRYDRVAREVTASGLTEPEVLRRLRAASIDGEVSIVRCDASDDVVAATRYLGHDVSGLVGRPATLLYPVLADELGHRMEVLAMGTSPGALGRVVGYDGPGGAVTVALLLTRAGPPPHTTSRLAAVLDVLEPVLEPMPEPVSIRLARR